MTPAEHVWVYPQPLPGKVVLAIFTLKRAADDELLVGA
jgi:hypothetical protein